MRSSNNRIQYYVEGECERKLVKTLIGQQLIRPGQTDVLNPIQERIKSTHLRKLPANTTVVLIFDTDTGNTDILKENIQTLKEHSNIKEIILIPQVTNLEEELIRCTDIRKIRELIGCRSDKDFKAHFIEEKRVYEKLQAHHFDMEKLWTSTPGQAFQKAGIQNQSEAIRLKKN